MALNRLLDNGFLNFQVLLERGFKQSALNQSFFFFLKIGGTSFLVLLVHVDHIVIARH